MLVKEVNQLIIPALVVAVNRAGVPLQVDAVLGIDNTGIVFMVAIIAVLVTKGHEVAAAVT